MRAYSDMTLRLKRSFALPVLAAMLVAGAFANVAARGLSRPVERPFLLPPVAAVGERVDTLFVGGYAQGSFTEALHTLASGLSPQEREMVGQHLDRIFVGVAQGAGLGHAGRLRVAYERTVRPDGTTRSIRVLTAEAAMAGEIHTAYYFERDGKPGYFDPFGHSLDGQEWSGPLAYLRVTSAFGSSRMHPILGRILPHTGVDYGAPTGTPVRATADGVVVAAGPHGGYGNLIEIQHANGYSTRYAHLSAFAAGLHPNRWVRQGEVVGYVGMTGLATGPHLHYEVLRNGHPVDPLRVTAAGTVSGDLTADPTWSVQQQRLARLLARAPEVLQGYGLHS